MQCDVICCNAVITACEKGGQWLQALSVLTHLEEHDGKYKQSAASQHEESNFRFLVLCFPCGGLASDLPLSLYTHRVKSSNFASFDLASNILEEGRRHPIACSGVTFSGVGLTSNIDLLQCSHLVPQKCNAFSHISFFSVMSLDLPAPVFSQQQ